MRFNRLLEDGVSEDAIPDDNAAHSTSNDLAALLAAMSDQPDFDPDLAQQFVTDNLESGDLVDRDTMAAIICAGLDSCDPTTTDTTQQVLVMAEEGITVGHTGGCVPPVDPAACIADYNSEPGEIMTNAQMVAFLSRVIDEDDDGDDGNYPTQNNNPPQYPQTRRSTHRPAAEPTDPPQNNNQPQTHRPAVSARRVRLTSRSMPTSRTATTGAVPRPVRTAATGTATAAPARPRPARF